jgi:phosphoglycerate kinase
MGERIGFLKEVVGRSVEKKVGALKGGEVLLLENVRFHPGEEKNSKAFARMLSGLADCYVNEAFADSHRNHASIATVPRLLPSYAGFRFAEEVTVFTRVFSRPVRPFVALIGGAKVDAKLSCLQRLLRVADHVLVGGDIANAVLFYERGKRVLRAEKTALKRLFASRTIRRLVVPCDVTERQPRMVYTVAAGQVRNRRSIIDIGPLTVHLYRRYLELARTVVWNGPVGVTEVMEGARSSEDLARSIANLKAQTIVGGGETVTFLQNLGLTGRYTHVSTGGGAMLALLAGEILPGLTALTVR